MCASMGHFVIQPSNMSEVRKKQSNRLFTYSQEIWIILEYGALRNALQVRRNFREHFKIHPRQIPSVKAFKRLIDRFIVGGELKPPAKTGGQQCTINEEIIGTVKDYVDSKVKKGEHPSVNEIAIALQLSHSMTWRILRKNLGYKPFKPKTVAPPTEKHQRDRVQFCNWLLEQPSNFPSRCIWSDKKWFYLS